MAFHTNVANKTSCRSFCYSMTGCSYYTYHTLSDPDYPGACFLLSALQSPVRACSDCQTGVMDCSRKCFFLGEKDEITYGGVEITDSHQYTNLRPIALGNCLLVAVAVGGGGAGSSSSSYGGGGGSGFVEWKSENLTGTIELRVSVGGEGGSSSVTANGTTFVTAKSGYSASSTDGGMGYSGGGGGGRTNPGDGGSNGQTGGFGSGSSDSYYGSGGSGSGLDISTIEMKHFSLT